MGSCAPYFLLARGFFGRPWRTSKAKPKASSCAIRSAVMLVDFSAFLSLYHTVDVGTEKWQEEERRYGMIPYVSLSCSSIEFWLWMGDTCMYHANGWLTLTQVASWGDLEYELETFAWPCSSIHLSKSWIFSDQEASWESQMKSYLVGRAVTVPCATLSYVLCTPT